MSNHDSKQQIQGGQPKGQPQSVKVEGGDLANLAKTKEIRGIIYTLVDTLDAAPQAVRESADKARSAWRTKAQADNGLSIALMDLCNASMIHKVSVNQAKLAEYVGCSNAHISQIFGPYRHGRANGYAHETLIAEVRKDGLNTFRKTHRDAPVASTQGGAPAKAKPADLMASLSFAVEVLPVLIPALSAEELATVRKAVADLSALLVPKADDNKAAKVA
jgi:hypothetical protein